MGRGRLDAICGRKIVSRPIGIEAEGKLFVSAGSEAIAFRIIQTSVDTRYYRTQGELRIGLDLIQNADFAWQTGYGEFNVPLRAGAW
jgi:hypothetical protein